MQDERTTESLESAKNEYERREEESRQKYVPRPKSQVVLAWILLIIVVLGIINLCYIQITGA